MTSTVPTSANTQPSAPQPKVVLGEKLPVLETLCFWNVNSIGTLTDSDLKMHEGSLSYVFLSFFVFRY